MVMGNLLDPKPSMANRIAAAPQFDLPPIQVLYAVMFAVFLILFFVRIGSMFRSPGFYRPADVDVLFSTPVSPKAVLLHRFVLDYLLTLLMPLILLIFGGRGSAEGIRYLFRNLPDPSAAPAVGKTMILSFLLLTFFCVSLGYAISLYINRDTPIARRMRGAMIFTCWTAVLVLLTLVIASFWSANPMKELMAIPNSPYIKWPLFPIAMAGDLAVSPLYATWTQAWIAVAVLLGGSILFLFFAARQAHWLYDMAARDSAATANRRAIQQSGDMTLAIVKRAQDGKLKARKYRFLQNIKARGMWAILWREALLSLRTQTAMFVMFAITTTAVGLLVLSEPDSNTKVRNIMLPLQTFLLITSTMALSQSGFMETLRRVDLQKPLPFSPLQMCFMEVIGKSAGPLLIAFLVALVNFIVDPGAWQLWGTALIGLPSIALLVVAVQFLVILLFPDVDDPTQRTFRGMMQFLGSAFAVAPSIVVFALLAYFGTPLVLAALLGSAINVAVLTLLNSFSAVRYTTFNPSD